MPERLLRRYGFESGSPVDIVRLDRLVQEGS